MQELGGSTARQTARLASGNIPYHRCHAQLIKGGRTLSFWFLGIQILFWLGVWTFLGVWSFLQILRNSWKPWFPGSAIAARGLAANGSLGGEKNCIIYRLVCIFSIIIIIITIISTISSISISFVALLNCLYISPRVIPFVHFPSPSRWGGMGRKGRGRRVAVGSELLVAELNHDIYLKKLICSLLTYYTNSCAHSILGSLIYKYW